jgi:bacterioferritin
MASKKRSGKAGAGKAGFLSDVAELRRRARQHIQEGAVTPGYGADREKVIGILNDALATEIVCILRYKRHYFMATGIHANAGAQEFQQHAARGSLRAATRSTWKEGLWWT